MLRKIDIKLEEGRAQNHTICQIFNIDMLSQGRAELNNEVHKRLKRTGTLWTSSALIITAIIGSGILSLSWTVAQLGWIAGPVTLILFAFVSTFTSTLLSDCYPFVDLANVGDDYNFTFMEAVRSNLGGCKFNICGLVLSLKLLGVAIVYTIASTKSAMAIQKFICLHNSDSKEPCLVSPIPHTIWFAIVETILFQIPDFDKMRWLPIVSGIMSSTYTLTGLGLSIAEVVRTGKFSGSFTGIQIGTVTESQKILRIFQAFGIIAFAYSHPNILIEIQDTIKSPPSKAKTMKKAAVISYSFITFIYMVCACFGYAAFGDSTPGNLLTGFRFHSPYWIQGIANFAIVLHLVLAYQAFCQPLFAFAEKVAVETYPDHNFHTREIDFTCYKFDIYKFVWRLVFVSITTVVSIILHHSFSSTVGLLGAFGFWPLTVYFPVKMYIAQKNVSKWCLRFRLQILSITCLVVSLVAAAGSIAGFAHDLKSVKPFKTRY